MIVPATGLELADCAERLDDIVSRFPVHDRDWLVAGRAAAFALIGDQLPTTARGILEPMYRQPEVRPELVHYLIEHAQVQMELA